MKPTDGARRPRLALVAHDNRKADLLEWAEYNEAALRRFDLVATGTTGQLVGDRLERHVDCTLSGPLGGDLQIGAMISEQKVDALVFFWDPLHAQPHDPDVKALLRVAVVWNVPVACNRSTADMLIASPLMLDGTYERNVPSYERHTTRTIRLEREGDED